jgi:glycosyltransferase involved in cell wall biosynthesis
MTINEKFHVVVVSPWPPLKSGISDYCYKLYTKLARHCKVTVVAQRGANGNGQLKVENVNIRSVWKTGMIATFQIFREVLKSDPDVLHVQFDFSAFGSPLNVLLFPFFLFIFKLIRRFRILITLHEIPPLSSSMREEEADNAFLRLYLRSQVLRVAVLLYLKTLLLGVDRVIVHNVYMSKVLESYQLINENNRKVIIPHGTEICIYNEPNPTMKEKRIITFFGYLRPSKGLKYLIDAFVSLIANFPQYKNLVLRIVGGRAHQSSLELDVSVPSQYKDRIQLVGFVDEDDLDKLLAETDIFVLPYIDDFIGSSRALHRIACYGKPVICTKIPRFIGEVVNGFNGILVNPRSYKDLTTAIIKLLENRDFARRIGDNLRISLSQWSWDRVAELHYFLYKSCLEGHECQGFC